MTLTATQIKNAKVKGHLYRLSDGRGLALEIVPTGSKRWRFRYRFEGKEQMISLGIYPDVSLRDAREEHLRLRSLLAKGINPSEERKQRKNETAGKNRFESVAREWFEKNESSWSPSHASRVILRLEQNIFPWLGNTPIGDITPGDLLENLRRIEMRGAVETAHRVKGICGQVFRYAVATGRASRDITADLKDALPPVKVKHFPTITEAKKIGALLKAIEEYEGHFITKCALKLAPLTFVRPGELRHAEWDEIDLKERIWKIPAEKMKARIPHLVPLSDQAVEVLKEIQPLTGEGRYVFPSLRSKDRPISNNSVNSALRRMGYTKDEMTGHGFRSMASTLLHEQGWPSNAIERQLAHTDRDTVRATYNYAEYIRDRTKMMQSWAEFLNQCKAVSAN